MPTSPPAQVPYGITGPGMIMAVATPPLALPQTGNKTIFTTVGPVKIEQIFGIVTTVIGAVANATKLQFVCSSPVLGAVDLCGTADVNALAAGAIYSVTGTVATGAIIVAPNTGQIALAQATAWNLGTGVIRVNTAGSSVTGAIQWYCMYRAYNLNTGSITQQLVQTSSVTAAAS